VRDVAPHLDGVLNNIDRFSNLFKRTAYLFIENDSQDESLLKLQQWCGGRLQARIISHNGLDQIRAARTQRLAFCRNLILHELRKPDYHEFDVVIMLDMDEVNASPIDIVGFTSALNFLVNTESAAAVTAYQDPYYDLWALRHAKYFPVDIWHECLRLSLEEGTTDQSVYSATLGRYPLDFLIQGQPVEVDSAFGGLGVYKRPSIATNPCGYIGEYDFFSDTGSTLQFGKVQQCEHVSFHSGFKMSGKSVVIFPEMKNRGISGKINPLFFKTIII
jgi:hypothetical protein